MRFRILATLLAGVAGLVACPLAAEPLTLDEAIRRSLTSSPQGEAAAARIEILEAARAAADTKPAATIDGSVENIGTGGFNVVQVDATYNLRLERGGKRLARIALAEGDIGIAQAEALIRRLDLAQDVQELYVEAQAATLRFDWPRAESRLPSGFRPKCSAASPARVIRCSPAPARKPSSPKRRWTSNLPTTP